MKLLVVGAGATGGYFGGRLAEVGRDVTFLVRPARALQLLREGLVLNSPHGDSVITPQLTTSSEIKKHYDVILLSVKAYGLDQAMADCAAAVGPNTVIIPVLNGMAHIEKLINRFGPRVVLGGVCKVAASIDDRGRIVQLAPFQELVYGELGQPASSNRRDGLDALFTGAGFDAKWSSDIRRELWQKWIFLASLGAITTLARGNVGEIAATESGDRFVREMLREIVAIAGAHGFAPGDKFVQGTTAVLTQRESGLTSSMYRDLVKGAKIEAEHIIGDLLRRGDEFQLPSPLLRAVYTNLRIYENGNAVLKG